MVACGRGDANGIMVWHGIFTCFIKKDYGNYTEKEGRSQGSGLCQQIAEARG